jgi:tetratricopeptide (TPR) repeat protein
MRAIPLLSRLDRAEFLQAGDLLRRATARDPGYAGAHIWSANWNIILLRRGWASDAAAAMTEAGWLANRAIELDPRRARAFAIAGDVRAALHRRPHEALLLHERALQINPNLGMAWALSAAVHANLGDFAEAERRMRHYKMLLPLDPLACFYDVTFVVLALLRHDHEAAATLGRMVCDMNADYSAACQPYLAALGHLGRHGQAAVVRGQLLATDPGFTIARFVASSPLTRSGTDHVVAGLRLAQVPEG